MQAAGSIPETPKIELDDLSEVLQADGPFLTVYLTTEAAVENAGPRSQQRWKALRNQLEADGATKAALDAVDPLVEDAHQSGAMLAVIATDDGVQLVEHLQEPTTDDRGRWSRLPDLVPLLRWRQSQVPYVLALADRGGADLIAERPGRTEIERTAGEGEPMSKVHPGGMSQSRYQQRAENDWADTAGDVAAKLAGLSEQVDARLIILGGDVRATHMIRGDLSPEMEAKTYLIDPGRAADGSEGSRDREVRRLVATAVAEDTVALFEKFREECGQDDRAVEGATSTIDALNRSAVAVLFVHDDDQERSAWIGQPPVPLGIDRQSAEAAGALGPVEQARLVDALIAAALVTGATVRIIPEAGPVADGLGALLRWADHAG